MFIRLFVLFHLFCTGTIFAPVLDHVKKVTHKGRGHRMRNIDFIYLINLKQRPEKYESCMAQLRPYSIQPYRFSAINGWKLSLKVLNDLGVAYQPGMLSNLMATYFPLDGDGQSRDEIMNVPGRTYFAYHMTRGAIGCALSHLSILKDALRSKYKTIWVMEDDISLILNPHTISDRIDALDKLVGKKGWDVLFTDQDTIDNATGTRMRCLALAPRPNYTPQNPSRIMERVEINGQFRKIGGRYGMYSVIFRRSGIKKILGFIEQYNLFLPIDIELFLPPNIRAYTVTSDIVSTQRYAPSDNSQPGIDFKDQRKFSRDN